jgi:hypothetical protein
MSQIKSKAPWGLAAAAIATLAACGGGGGDAPTGVEVPAGVRSESASTSSDVNGANYSSFAGPLARAVMGAGDGGSVPGLSVGRESPQSRTLTQRGQRWARLVVANVATREQALTTQTETLNCPYGGSMTVTFNDADNNQKLSSGDSASFVFSACVAEFGQPAATGSLGFTVNAIELDAQDEPTALDVTLAFSGFSESGFGSIAGTVRLWSQDEGTGARYRVRYSSTAITEQGAGLAYNFDIYGVSSEVGGSFDLNGALVVGGQAYSLRGGDVFSYLVGQPPSSGSVRLCDAGNDCVTLRATSATTFNLEFLANGATTPVVLTGLTWASQRLGPT